jgi:putative transposase
LEQTPREWRRQLIQLEHDNLSNRRQCELLGLNRSTLYYKAVSPEIADVDLLNAIRDVWERYPFYGYRRTTKELKSKGIKVNHKRVQRLMQKAGIEAIYPGPNTSKRNKLHAIHPYLLRRLQVTRANQVFMVDITYLRMPTGFMYLVALIDVYSRYVVSWALSNTLETSSCIDALRSALTVAKPEIVNSDQGSQFTSDDWIDFLREQDIKISMTGKGRCSDNIYIERFWRSFKREEFYLNEYNSIKDLKKRIKAYIEFYNQKRWHQSLDYKTPADVYFGGPEEKKPMDMWTSPSDQSAPFGPCGQAVDNAKRVTHNLTTLADFSPTYPQAQ